MGIKMKMKIGICGYGNLGRGIEAEINKNADMELAAIFTRRKPAASLVINSDTPVMHVDDIADWKHGHNQPRKIDILILCGGSAVDLPEQSPLMAGHFNIVDSFDTHAKIPAHKKSVHAAAAAAGNIAVISAGWDPGFFSLLRLYSGAILPSGTSGSFWGYGVSQGHSDAVRRIAGVTGAIQYSIPQEEAIEKARQGKAANLSPREKHKRLCYVATEPDADRVRIEKEIKEMPNYFADYDTDVVFISLDELTKNHSRFPHGGKVIHTGQTGDGNRQAIELSLKLDSNPEFTASFMLASARAACRMSREGLTGARTVFDIPPAYFSPLGDDEMVRLLL